MTTDNLYESYYCLPYLRMIFVFAFDYQFFKRVIQILSINYFAKKKKKSQF